MPAAPWVAEALLVVLRWLHGLAAIGLLGWTAVYLIDGAREGQNVSLRRRYKEVVEITLLVFLASGAILTFDRLSRGAGGVYAGLLALKILLGIGSYQYAFRWRRGGLRADALDGRLVLVLGAGTVLLAAVLKGVYESGLRSNL